jgi:localization factor PodJL
MSIDRAVAEIMARQRVLEGEADGERPPAERAQPPAPVANPSEIRAAPRGGSPPAPEGTAAPAAPDFGGLERQLRQITARIEALRPASELETAIKALRTDLSDIGRSLTEALPRRAVESLEIEIKALAQRIDHSRASGVDAGALARLERGLQDVREGLRGLTTAESLVGVDAAVKALAKKVDVIAAKDDPAALQQLEAAIGALRGIVSHVASNDTLTKVAEEVRALSGKVDGVANNAASGHALSALESRIDTLATALNASAEAGHAVPRELEKLLGGLIEKLEWVQLTHTDHAALAHLEDRIAMLVKRLDASDARLGQLDGIERGLADLLVHIDQTRGATGKGEAGIAAKAAAGGAIARDLAQIKQTERRTQDSLEAFQGTVEHVVDRLAMIESDMRGDKAKPAAAPATTQKVSAPPRPAPPNSLESLSMMSTSAPAAAPPKPAPAEPIHGEPAPLPRPASARPPIDPNLPPDHPLEPGSATGRSRPTPAAERASAAQAASAAGSKPPVIPDPGGRPDYIAAARRAAQVAAAASPRNRASAATGAKGSSLPRHLTQHLRKFIVAAAVVIIIAGGVHIALRLFDDTGTGAAPEPRTESESPPPAAAPAPAVAPAAPSAPAQGPKVIQLPVPGANPAPAKEPPASAPAIGTKPRRQSLNDEPPSLPGPDFTTTMQLLPPPANAPPAPPAPPPQPAPVAAPLTDKLPATIGGPSLRAAALAGDAAAQYEVGVRFADGRGVAQNAEEAVRWLDRAAKGGSAPAMFRLGAIYEKGAGAKKDLAAARDHYRAAAEKGHGKAMHNLAVLYAEGVDGAAADYRTAAEWFRKAADRGVADSQYNLGILYARGIGVEHNFAEAYKWFSLAAKEGDKDAAKKRDEIAAHLDQQSLAAARAAVEQWTPLPQPPEATPKGAWDLPASPVPPAKPKPRSAKVSVPEAVKLN